MLGDWLRDAAQRLAPVSDTARLDAELLAAHAAGMERADMLLRARDMPVPVTAEALIERRLRHEPVAYIIGYRDFWTLRLRVTPDVLIPRPDSETLIEAAIAQRSGAPDPLRILDLGTGSGALLLAALDVWRQASGIGVDASPAALAVAADNADRCGLGDRALFRPGDWGAGLDERFDLVFCNPPYIASDAPLAPGVTDYEPHQALFAGPDGLDAWRIILPQLPVLLNRNGAALLEVGWDQADAVTRMLAEQGLAARVHHDLGGQARCLCVYR